jgi:putative transcriptional regulator
MLYPVLTVIRFRLKEVREARELTQLELAQRVGVRQATISDLETGRAKTLRLTLLDALCNALGAEPAELIEYDAPKRRG